MDILISCKSHINICNLSVKIINSIFFSRFLKFISRIEKISLCTSIRPLLTSNVFASAR